MKLHNLNIEPLEIPFKVAFQHSSATRAATEAVLVTAKTQQGISGKGEGCPRHYVTGETVKSAIEFFHQNKAEFLNITSLQDLQHWRVENQSLIDQHPAAYCAVELALLHALANSNHQSLESLLSLPDLSGEFQYTAVLGSSNPDVFRGLLQKYLEYGFNDFKVKLFGDIDIDQKNLNHLSKSNNIRIRFDANNLWLDLDAAKQYLGDLKYTSDHRAFALEEPLAPRDFTSMRQLAEALNTRIILDESFTRLSDFKQIRDDPETWIVNIRISKMGGIFRSMEIAEKAKNMGIPIIIGAQVGETSLLTRAALPVAQSFRNILIAQEGGYGTFLLEYDLLDPPIMFGNGGVISADQLLV